MGIMGQHYVHVTIGYGIGRFVEFLLIQFIDESRMDAMRAAVLMLACASVVQRIYQSGSKSKEVVPLLRKSGRPSSQRLEDIETKPREKALERFKSGNSSTDVVFTGAQWWKVSADGHFTADKEESIVKITNRYFGENPNSRMQHFVVNDDTRSLAIRALTAQKWILDDAIALLDNMLEWRLENRVDDLLSEPLPVETLHHIRSCLFDGFYGVCNDGFPIYFCFGGRLDLAECTRLVGLEAIIKYHIQVMEYNHHVYYKKVSSMIGQTVSKVTLVLDLSGFGGHNVKVSTFYICLKFKMNPF